MKYVIAVAVIALIITGVFVINALKEKRNLIRYLKSSYGKTPNRKYDEFMMEGIVAYWKSRSGSAKYIIDDTTWSDLDMDSVFRRINCTCSGIGDEYLYSALHEPVFDVGRLEQLEKAVQYIDANENMQLRLRYLLAKLGRITTEGLVNFMAHPEARELQYRHVYPMLAVLAAASVVLTFINVHMFLPFLLFMMVINIVVYLKTKRGLETEFDALSYISSMIWCAHKISAVKLPEGKEQVLAGCEARLSEYLAPLKRIGGMSSFIMSGNDSNSDILAMYFKMFFMLDFLVYGSIVRAVKKYTREFNGIYETLGFLDMAASIASYRKSVKFYTLPDFIQNDEIVLGGLIHPLIKKPVPNTVTVCRSSLITGSNASGKSTFVKAVAVNAIFAQTIHTCLAKEFHMKPSLVITSMAVRDSIECGESYYIAEIKSLKRLLGALNGEVRCLCFIDEILKGTNTIERVAASASILVWLERKNCIVIAATHDIELTEMTAGLFDNYHFMEHIADDGVKFDYKIREGRSVTKNAVKLLEFMGYPREIVIQANTLASDFEEKRQWAKLQPIEQPKTL